MVHLSGILNPYKTTSLRGYPNIFIRRLDLLPDDQNGNKGFKLKYNLEKALAMSDPHILTFGGYYSNHLHAAAAACSKAQIRLTAVIRGEEPKTYGKTLSFLVDHGARLHFVSRKVYSEKYGQPFFDEMRRLYGNYLLIPEGGANKEGVRGCMEILQEEDDKYTHICCACGTGTMAAGLLMTLKTHQHLIVFSSLAGGDFQKDEIARLCFEAGMTSDAVQQMIGQLTLITNYHFGGYAKWDEELITFIKTFHERELIPLEQVYTGKMLFGLTKCLSDKSEIFPSGSNVLAIHSGGLQGAIPELTFS